MLKLHFNTEIKKYFTHMHKNMQNTWHKCKIPQKPYSKEMGTLDLLTDTVVELHKTIDSCDNKYRLYVI